MSRFIHLSSKIINSRHISWIDIKPKMYEINFSSVGIDGGFLLGGGSIDSYTHKIQVLDDGLDKDYETVTKWLEKERWN